LGARIGETLSTKVSDYYEEDGAKYVHVRGNKSSPNREARVVLAPPAIDKWLEKGHPDPEDGDAYLFCQTEGGKTLIQKQLTNLPAIVTSLQN